jgi:hypothetical protein
MLGASVEELDKGHFEAAIARAQENLNRIFHQQLPPAADLQKLKDQTAQLGNAIEGVVQRAGQLNSKATGDLRLVADRIRKLSSELGAAQSNLEQGRLELNLHIQVSTGSNAHSIFLEELGTALKQAIDKFTDPQTHFEHKLERLITKDVVSFVTTCDTQISPPGEDKELEERLKALFRAADLKPIQPIHHEPFQPAEHNIVQITSGGRSQSIAKTLCRGFYYKEALLCKADVVIYG